jgi:hypothetical protein
MLARTQWPGIFSVAVGVVVGAESVIFPSLHPEYYPISQSVGAFVPGRNKSAIVTLPKAFSICA